MPEEFDRRSAGVDEQAGAGLRVEDVEPLVVDGDGEEVTVLCVGPGVDASKHLGVVDDEMEEHFVTHELREFHTRRDFCADGVRSGET